MARSAPRIAWPLVAAIPRLDGGGRPIAETWRQLGALADRLGVTRPSYEQTRVLVLRARSLRAMPGTSEPVVAVLTRAASPVQALVEILERSADLAAAHDRIERERSWRPPAPRR